jgi:hypothetical protein
MMKGIEGLTESLIFVKWAFDKSSDLLEEKQSFQGANDDTGMFKN